MTDHHYALDLIWQGNRGTGTSGYRDYGREVTLRADGKPDLLGSADPTFRGDATRWNPEELLLAALAQCHLLSYLHSAVLHGIVVTAYDDSPVGVMEQSGNGGHFTSVTLRPRVTVAEPAHVDLAREIHGEASRNCFIAASVNFPVLHEPEIRLA
ncbi:MULTISPECIES: OsmC family protein [unclassified Nocardioides]|uniref:OsmC family protein n=1 Tax=unclassified Nocardioides TaxID=2615069 RepID=UPI0006FC86D9|nr:MULTISPECIES: OsmC family protein [unclassified Nocardioides]KRA31302.1 peroxiredoxin [Nocardioides sp. Root614]KRA87923.1 peroxiredoxin [Nocardioides sp. Root682]